MVLPIRACVFVPEADHVSKLVHHDAELVTVLPDADRLGAVTTLTDEAAAPGGTRGVGSIVGGPLPRLPTKLQHLGAPAGWGQ